MSRIQHLALPCPSCGAEHPATLFISLNARRMPQHVAEIVDGAFEVQRCDACGHEWQPEHRMLFSWPERRLWVVMMPPDQRHRFASLEAAVVDVLRRAFDVAPAVLEQRLADNEMMLVFGQHALAERVRLAALGLDHGAVESLKMKLLRTWDIDPACELRFVGLEDDSAGFAVFRRLSDDVAGPPETVYPLERARFEQALSGPMVAMARGRYPELFQSAWCDTGRYTQPQTVGGALPDDDLR